MLLTFADLQSSRLLQIASAPPASAEFASLCNAAIEQLMQRGNWWSTVQPIQGCAYDGFVAWPRNVAAVLAMDVSHHPTVPANRWYSFLQWDSYHIEWASRWHEAGRRLVSENDGTIPVFNPIPPGFDRFIQFTVDNPLDVGKTVTLYGIDSNGQAFYGQRADGSWQDGLVLTLATPNVQTTPTATWDGKVRRIDRVVKAPTLGRVRGWQVDDSGTLYDLAVYEPSETNPDYVRTRFAHKPGKPACLNALVKLGFVPVQYPNDLVGIENIPAIRDMVMAIKAKEAGNVADANAAEANAFRELNYQMRNRFPIEQFTTSFRPFGNAPLSRVTGGFM